MNILTIDRDADTPLYIQIRDNIIEAISNNTLSPGDRLPSVSTLSREIGVTQATIRRALQDLGEAGHTECHVGRGTFIRDASTTKPDNHRKQGSDKRETILHRKINPQHPVQRPFEYAAKRMRSAVRKALVDIMPLAHKEGIIQLTRGIPDGKLLPPNFIEEVNEETLAGGSSQFIQATEELGMYELREEIATRFNEDGAYITPDQVLITNGSMQAITLVAQTALDKRPGVICETPCFQGIPDTFSSLGHWVESVERDKEGPLPEKLHRLSQGEERLLYLCPYLHNPTGVDISADRYKEITDWARSTGSVVMADELFKDLRFAGDAPPSFYNSLGGDHTIIVSSLSKSVMTGLRLGWLISSPEKIREIAHHKRLMDHSTPAFIQGMALTILQSGKYDSHTEQMKTIYQERMVTLLKSLDKLMPKGVTWSKPVGGFSLFVELPKGYSSVALLLSAIDKGVSFLPGPLFDIDHRFVHALRLSTAWADKHQIKEGVELLASAVEELISQPPGDSGLSGLGNFQ